MQIIDIEKEIERGLLDRKDYQSSRSVGFIRNFELTPDALVCPDKNLGTYYDLCTDGKPCLESKKNLDEVYKRIMDVIPPSNVSSFTIHWLDTGITPTYPNHKVYLNEFSEQVKSSLQDIIHQHLDTIQNKPPTVVNDLKNLENEISCHSYFCSKAASEFCGREDAIGELKTILQQGWSSSSTTNIFPLLVHGFSGCGKSYLASKLIVEASEWTQKNDLVTIYRFVGETPGSRDLHSVLKSICKQICLVYSIRPFWSSVYMNLTQLITFFHVLIEEIKTFNKPLLIILDGLDQLQSPLNEESLVDWLPRQLHDNCMIVLTTEANVKNIRKNFESFYDSILNPDAENLKLLETNSFKDPFSSVGSGSTSSRSKRRKSRDSISFSFKKRHSLNLQRKSSKISPRLPPLLTKRPSLPSEMTNGGTIVANGDTNNNIMKNGGGSTEEPIYESIDETIIPQIKIKDEDKSPTLPNGIICEDDEHTGEGLIDREVTHEGILVGRESTAMFVDESISSRQPKKKIYHLYKLNQTLSSADRILLQTNHLQSNSCTLTQDQSDYLKSCIENCPEPLYIKLVTDIATTWKSNYGIDSLTLPMTVSEVIDNKLKWLEKQCGLTLVSHAVSLITLSKNGLTESQLLELLSMDNNVLNEVFEDASPLSEKHIRLPSLLWKRLQFYLGPYLEETNDNGYVVMRWSHKRISEVVIFRYLQNETKVKYLTRLLSEFFFGLHYDVIDQDAKTLTLNRRRSKIRYSLHQLTPQPSMIRHDSFNIRKLTELPLCIIKNGNVKVLFNQLFFNYDWIHQKVMGTSINDVIDDYNCYLKKAESFEIEFIRNAFTLESIQIEKNKRCFYNILLKILEGVDLDKFSNLKRLYDGACQYMRLGKSPMFHYPDQILMQKQQSRIFLSIRQPGNIKFVHFLHFSSSKRMVCLSIKHSKAFLTFYTCKQNNILSCLVWSTEVAEPLVLMSKTTFNLSVGLDDLHIINTKSMKEVFVVKGDSQGSILCLQENGSGSRLAVMYENGVIRIMQQTGGSFKILTEVDTGCTITRQIFFVHQSSTEMLMVPYLENTLAVVDSENLNVDRLSLAKVDKIKPGAPTLFYETSGDLVCSLGREINSWNIKTKSFFTYFGHSSDVTVLTKLNAETFASGSQSGQIRLWSLVKEALIHSLEGHYESIISMKYNDLSNTLVTCGEDDLIMVWDLEVNSLRESSSVNRLQSFDIDQTNTMAVIGSKDKYLRVIELIDDVVDFSSQCNLNSCLQLSLSPSNEHALIMQSKSNIALWDISDNMVVWEYDGIVTSSCFPTLTHFFIGTPSGNLHVGKIERKGRTNTVHKLHGHEICLLKHFHDSSLLVCSTEGSILNFDYTDRSVQQSTQPHNDAIVCVTLNDDYIAFGSKDCRISIFSRDGAKIGLLHICNGENPVQHLAIVKTHGHLISGNNGGINVWDLKSGTVLINLAFTIDGLNMMLLDPLSDRLLIATSMEKRQLFELDYTTSANPVNHLKGHTDAISCMRITSSMKYLITSSFDGTLKVWDNQTKKMVDSIQLQSKIIDFHVTDIQENWYHKIYVVTCSKTLVVLNFALTSRKESKRSIATTGYLIMLNDIDPNKNGGVVPNGNGHVKKVNSGGGGCCTIV